LTFSDAAGKARRGVLAELGVVAGRFQP